MVERAGTDPTQVPRPNLADSQGSKPTPGRPEADKVRSMFSEIANRYDSANTVLSAGIHHLWRKQVVKWSGAQSGNAVLDCATGTGDLAIEFAHAVGPTGRVVGTDFCAPMLAPAPAKAERRGLNNIEFAEADVTQLPYPSSSFDIASISFGIRNVSDPVKGLAELARVVRPGGTVMVLEFGRPQNALIGPAFTFYSEKILPRIGGWLTGKPQAYQYLQDSSAQFPFAERFCEMMRSTDAFSSVSYRPLSFGIAYAYKGVRKDR